MSFNEGYKGRVVDHKSDHGFLLQSSEAFGG